MALVIAREWLYLIRVSWLVLMCKLTERLFTLLIAWRKILGFSSLGIGGERCCAVLIFSCIAIVWFMLPKSL